MASVSITVSLLLLQLFSISSSVIGSSAPEVDCATVIVDLAGCLSFVVIGGRAEKPEGSCCSGLKKILDTSPKCLCVALKTSDSLGFKLNVTKAYSLPQACNLKAPPVSSCGLVSTPGVAPAPIVVPAAAPVAMRGPVSGDSPAPSPSQANLAASSFTPISLIAAGFIILFSRF